MANYRRHIKETLISFAEKVAFKAFEPEIKQDIECVNRSKVRAENCGCNSCRKEHFALMDYLVDKWTIPTDWEDIDDFDDIEDEVIFEDDYD